MEHLARARGLRFGAVVGRLARGLDELHRTPFIYADTGESLGLRIVETGQPAMLHTTSTTGGTLGSILAPPESFEGCHS